jgi:hypothetical protein
MLPLKPGIVVLPLLLVVFADSGIPASAPSFSNEQLNYSIDWPSGLSLGEAHLKASRSKTTDAPERLNLEFDIEAAIPGFQVLDHYRSASTPGFCSAEFERNFTHGKKKSEEKTTFDSKTGLATRQTNGGGKSEMDASSCGRDALTFLYFVRNELSQGRLPPRQTVFFGAAYQVRLEFGGTQQIKLGNEQVETDKLIASLKGPSSDLTFEVFFLKDAARTPVLVRVPLTLGTFSMELAR